MDNGQLFPTEEGAMQGGPISPLLANIALHGLERVIKENFSRRSRRGFNPPQIIRYADDFVVLHEDQNIVQQCQEIASAWLKETGLELKPSKTRITHTLEVVEGKPGFDFLGFHIRQYCVGKTKSGKDSRGCLQGFKTHIKPSKAAIQRHVEKLHETINTHKQAEQKELIEALNPKIMGWSHYYAHVVSAKVFRRVDNIVYGMLQRWAVYRHPNKNKHWIINKYWRVDEGKGWIFQPPNDGNQLYRHNQTRIRRHIKIQGRRSPYDGDWIYWSKRMGRHPEVSERVAKLLKKQKGKCWECGLYFLDGDKMEIDHLVPKRLGGNDAIYNLQLLHRHCHDAKTARDTG